MDDFFIYLIVVLIAATFSVFNIITIAIILNDKKLRRSVTIRPIFSFLAASTIQGLLPAPLYIYKRLEHMEHLAEWICDGYRIPYFLCGHMMKISLALISIERLVAVKYPFKGRDYITKKRITIATIMLWVVTIAVDTAPFFTDDKDIDSCSYTPEHDWGLSVIICYNILPFLIILINYSIIWVIAARLELKDKILRRRFMNDQIEDKESPSDNGRNILSRASMASTLHSPVVPELSSVAKRIKFAFEIKATKSSLALITAYLFCWGPLGVFYMIDHFCYNCLSDDDDLKLTRAIVKLLSFSSSILAPIVYCWWNRGFRKTARRLWNKFICKPSRSTFTEEHSLVQLK